MVDRRWEIGASFERNSNQGSFVEHFNLVTTLVAFFRVELREKFLASIQWAQPVDSYLLNTLPPLLATSEVLGRLFY